MTFLRPRQWVVPLAGVMLACAAASPAPVQAQADRNAEARVYFEQGNRHLTRAMQTRGARRRALLQQALDSYVESLGIVRSRNVLFNAAFAMAELGRHDEAFSYYTEYVAMPGLSEDEIAEARRRLQELEPRVAILQIASEPSGAEIRIDRRDLAARGRTPLEVPVPAGEHRVFLTLDGYRPAEVTATATIGERVPVQARLEAVPVPVVIRAPAGGRLTINGETVQPGQEIRVIPGRHTIRFEPAVERVIEIRPGDDRQVIELDVPEQPRARGVLAFTASTRVRVAVDGVVVGEGNRVEANVASGRRVVEITAPGYASTRSEIDVEPAQRVELRVHMERSVSSQSTLGDVPLLAWLATGVVGAAAIALSVNAIVLQNDYDELGSMYPGSPRDEQVQASIDAAFEDAEEANLIADIFWAATAAVGVTAIVLTILDRPVQQSPSLIQVAAAPIEGGAMVLARLPWGTP